MFLRRRLGDALASKHRQSSGVVAATPQASMASPSTALASPWHGRRRLEGQTRERSTGKESARAGKESARARGGREEKGSPAHGGREEKLLPAPAPVPSPFRVPLHRLPCATLLCSAPVRQTRRERRKVEREREER
jgi:hypothetical protein